MNKTIEELAKQYAEYMWPAEDYSDSDCDDGRDTDIAISIDDARSVLRWFFNRPLAQRLTDMQKEMVRGVYKGIQSDASFHEIKKESTKDQTAIKFHSQCKDFYVSQLKLLKHLFGKEFFKEGE